MSLSPEDRNVARAAKLDTASISDAMDRLRISGQCQRIAPRDPSFRLTGRAFTVLYRASGTLPGTVGDYIDDVPAGSVIALDNGGREDATVWGDLLTETAHRRGIAGTVIDGICRDVTVCLGLGYPVYSRGHWMRTGKDRVEVEATNVPITIGGARVAPGDLLRGDADGIVAIRRADEERVLAAAEEIEATENRIREAIRAGSRLDEARASVRYHELQRK